MSTFHDQPNDFVDWLTSQPETASAGPHSFAPRRMFGAYIRALLNDEMKHSGRDRLALVRGAVTSLDQATDKLTLKLDRDRTIPAEFAVLATGNFPPEPVLACCPGFYDTHALPSGSLGGRRPHQPRSRLPHPSARVLA